MIAIHKIRMLDFHHQFPKGIPNLILSELESGVVVAAMQNKQKKISNPVCPVMILKARIRLVCYAIRIEHLELEMILKPISPNLCDLKKGIITIILMHPVIIAISVPKRKVLDFVAIAME